MTLTNKQEDEVRKRVIEQFGIESVKKMDQYYIEMNDLRIKSKDAYEFLDKVKELYSGIETELLIAAILYGMKQGELGYEYHLRLQAMQNNAKPLPYGHAT